MATIDSDSKEISTLTSTQKAENRKADAIGQKHEESNTGRAHQCDSDNAILGKGIGYVGPLEADARKNRPLLTYDF
ncbi:hypothetical protein JCGZ_18185 [Jatropha curcas]|uniref:Uncharacterized protein n=1 Tax=Jatropha curcas TaxID=180498 RepID=A0A067K2B2_JATCU|nr:hypothetical protein JCGZ_18185 [Jatropha curcas]